MFYNSGIGHKKKTINYHNLNIEDHITNIPIHPSNNNQFSSVLHNKEDGKKVYQRLTPTSGH